MVKMRTMDKAEAQKTRTPKAPGVRRARMNLFDEYVDALRQNPDEGVIYEELDEAGHRFVLTLRGAFQRAGMENVVVRKLRGRDEVRVWRSDVPIHRKTRVAPAAPVPAKRGGRGRKAS
jgi:hypothetical protein